MLASLFVCFLAPEELLQTVRLKFHTLRFSYAPRRYCTTPTSFAADKTAQGTAQKRGFAPRMGATSRKSTTRSTRPASTRQNPPRNSNLPLRQRRPSARNTLAPESAEGMLHAIGQRKPTNSGRRALLRRRQRKHQRQHQQQQLHQHQHRTHFGYKAGGSLMDAADRTAKSLPKRRILMKFPSVWTAKQPTRCAATRARTSWAARHLKSRKRRSKSASHCGLGASCTV